MNVAQKLDLAKRHIDNISRHDDEDADVRRHILQQVRLHIADELDAIDARIDARKAELGLPARAA